MNQNEEKKAWITKHASNRCRQFAFGNLTIQNCHVGLSFYPEHKQLHINFDRETMLLILEAILKELKSEEKDD